MRGHFIVLAGLLALSSPAAAQRVLDACPEPIAPPALDGDTASEDLMKTDGDQVRIFIRNSDSYQECLLKVLDDAAKAAQQDQTFVDPRLQATIQTKVQSNQLLKERVGALFNDAVRVYKAKHPG